MPYFKGLERDIENLFTELSTTPVHKKIILYSITT